MARYKFPKGNEEWKKGKRPMSYPNKVMIRLSDEQLEKLKCVAEEKGVKVPSIIREFVDSLICDKS